LIGVSLLDSRQKKGILARAHWGGNREKKAARKLASQQISRRKHNEVALFIGSPRNSSIKMVNGKKVIHLPVDPQTVYLPHAEAGISVCGGPGSGKSFSFIDPAVRSAIDQGFPVIYYDYKGHENPTPSSKLAGYAESHGYKISVFAPGSPETCVCNPFDFLRSKTDAEMARQIATVLNKNLKLAADASTTGSGFFTEAGDQLAQAVFMLAKGSQQYGDVMLCQKILSLDNLQKRLQHAPLNPWVRTAFDQFFSTAGTPETAASIAATASLLFTRFMIPSALAAFCGPTTLPLVLEGRQMVVFRMDPQIRNVVGPLLASILHLLVNHNVFRDRKTPLVLALDELPSIYLPSLADWLNQNRSSGLVTIIGFQTLGLLEKTYGQNEANGILGGCATQAVFQLNDGYTAKLYSEALGQEEIQFKQKTRSHDRQGASHSLAEQQQTRPLCEVQQLESLPTGKCVLLNRGYSDGKEVRIPILQQIKISQRDIQAVRESTARWLQIQKQLITQSAAREPAGEELERREQEARRLLPLPEKAAETPEEQLRKQMEAFQDI
jgi:type IV secretory pathway TraG/TraD family ATPase VirD4